MVELGRDTEDEYIIELGEQRVDRHFDDAKGSLVTPPLRRPILAAAISENPFASIIFYCASGILLTCTNKFIVNSKDFNLPFAMLSIQAIVCLVVIAFAKAVGFISYRDFRTGDAIKWAPVSILLISMIYTSAKALQFLSIPVYTIFKNLTIIVTAYGEVLWFGDKVTPAILFSFALMVISSIIATWTDIIHAMAGSLADAMSTLNTGYIWMLLNCFCSAAFVLGLRKRIQLTKFKDFDTMFYNNLLALPIMIVCSLSFEDWSPANLALNFPKGQRVYYIIALLITGVSSIFISYATAWCIRVTSSTTYSMAGALNKLPIAISGFVFFNDVVTLEKVLAISVACVSGVIYAVARIWQRDRDRGTPKHEEQELLKDIDLSEIVSDESLKTTCTIVTITEDLEKSYR